MVEILGQGQTFSEAVMFMDKPLPRLCAGPTDSLLLLRFQIVIMEELENDPSSAAR